VTRRLVVAITGASGAVLGLSALQLARTLDDVETHLIVTRAGRETVHLELDMTVKDVAALADEVHADNDLASPLASGSFPVTGMLVAPCSVTSLSAIAQSYDATLTVRAADVTLKERRPLVLMLRETPLHAGHLRLMSEVTASGGIIMPPVPAYYLKSDSVTEMARQTVARAFDLIGMPLPDTRRWTGREEDA